MKTKSEKQAAALLEFAHTLKRRPARFRWNEPWPESESHHRWRVCSYLLYRCRLWLRAGLGEVPYLKLRSIERRERQARRAWQEEDQCEREEFRRSHTAMMEGLAPYEGDQR